MNEMEPVGPALEVTEVPEEDLWEVRELAHRIFPITYQDIVESGQIDYMMDLIYSPEALTVQLDSGQIFLIISCDGSPAGFASYTRLNDEGIFKLNKIYLDNHLQGKGIGKYLLMDVIERIKAEGAISLRLNVNRHNEARGFYEKMGFSILQEELIDIGNGYFMDDYVMELSLTPND
jgi:ribosomal protein S18 acetylase RimI-like enzyme